MQEEFGFTFEEQRFIARRKPNFMLYEKDPERGIESLTKLLVDELGFNKDLVRTLVLKYPAILG